MGAENQPMQATRELLQFHWFSLYFRLESSARFGWKISGCLPDTRARSEYRVGVIEVRDATEALGR